VIALVGNLETINQYVCDIVKVNLSPLDRLFIPEGFIPDLFTSYK